MLPFIKNHPLQKVAQELRGDLLDIVYKNGGHIGGSLSSLDLIITVYFSNLFNLKKGNIIFKNTLALLSVTSGDTVSLGIISY